MSSFLARAARYTSAFGGVMPSMRVSPSAGPCKQSGTATDGGCFFVLLAQTSFTRNVYGRPSLAPFPHCSAVRGRIFSCGSS